MCHTHSFHVERIDNFLRPPIWGPDISTSQNHMETLDCIQTARTTLHVAIEMGRMPVSARQFAYANQMNKKMVGKV